MPPNACRDQENILQIGKNNCCGSRNKTQPGYPTFNRSSSYARGRVWHIFASALHTNTHPHMSRQSGKKTGPVRDPVHPEHFFEVPKLSSGPEGSADLLICGDSSFAVIRQKFAAPLVEPEITRLNLASFLNQDSMPWCTRIRSRLEWGKGLGPIVRAIEEELQEMKDFNSRNGNPDRKILVLVPWAENDVYGDYGYAGCKWINQKRYLKTEADRKVAAEWPFAQLTRVREAVEKIIELRNQPEVADLVMIGNAPAEDYDLPKAYNRYLCEHYAYMISRGVPCVDPSTLTSQAIFHDQFHMAEHPGTLKWGVSVLSGIASCAFRAFQVMSYKEEIEPLTILNAGEGEGDLQLMEFFIRYPPISEVRATADVMLARRRAAEEVELNPADIVDSVEQEIMNWLQQEEEADQLRLQETSHVVGHRGRYR